MCAFIACLAQMRSLSFVNLSDESSYMMSKNETSDTDTDTDTDADTDKNIVGIDLDLVGRTQRNACCMCHR